MESGKMVVALSATMNWDLTSTGPDQISGIEKRGAADGPKLAGVRAPKLDRPMPKAWTKPRPLFNGKDLTGWEPIGNAQKNTIIVNPLEINNIITLK